MKMEEILKLQIADLDTEIEDYKRDIRELCDEARQLSKEEDNQRLMDSIWTD